jgi:hypothetical protein
MLTVFNSVGQDTQREHLDTDNRLLTALSIGEYPRQLWDFSQPAPIFLLLSFYRKLH